MAGRWRTRRRCGAKTRERVTLRPAPHISLSSWPCRQAAAMPAPPVRQRLGWRSIAARCKARGQPRKLRRRRIAARDEYHRCPGVGAERGVHTQARFNPALRVASRSRTMRRRGLVCGWSKVWLGKPDQAFERFAHAMRLSPFDPLTWWMQEGMAHAHFFASQYDEAVSWAKMALLEIDPALTVSNFLPNLLGPYRQREHLAKYADALRKAGLPE